MCAHIQMCSVSQEGTVCNIKALEYLPFKTSRRGGLQEKSRRSRSGIFRPLSHSFPDKEGVIYKRIFRIISLFAKYFFKYKMHFCLQFEICSNKRKISTWLASETRNIRKNGFRKYISVGDLERNGKTTEEWTRQEYWTQ